jgi:hypothetical protein
MLDDFLPRYDVHEVHSVSTSAAPAAVMEAIHQLTPAEVPVLVGLMAIRSVPALRETPDELVLGGVGRFWQPAGGLRRIAAAEFRDFDEPGFAKAAFNFQIERAGGRTLLRTETRVATTDAHARRSFGRYWRFVHPGSALIRIAWLRAIRRRAERNSA